MFTLNLKDIELTPRIQEDKDFQNAERYDLRMEVIEYIEKNYGETYKNPLTVSRKVDDAVRDGKGETETQQFDRERKERDESFESSQNARKAIEDEVKKKYEPEYDQLQEEKDKKIQELYDEYRPKLETLTDEGKTEEYRAMEEERSLKEDDLRYEYSQKEDALHAKRENEIEERVNVALGK